MLEILYLSSAAQRAIISLIKMLCNCDKHPASRPISEGGTNGVKEIRLNYVSAKKRRRTKRMCSTPRAGMTAWPSAPRTHKKLFWRDSPVAPIGYSTRYKFGNAPNYISTFRPIIYSLILFRYIPPPIRCTLIPAVRISLNGCPIAVRPFQWGWNTNPLNAFAQIVRGDGNGWQGGNWRWGQTRGWHKHTFQFKWNRTRF